jgi:hypothetical protein
MTRKRTDHKAGVAKERKRAERAQKNRPRLYGKKKTKKEIARRQRRTDMQRNWASKGFKQDDGIEVDLPTGRARKTEIERSTDKQLRELEKRIAAREAAETESRPVAVATMMKGPHRHVWTVEPDGKTLKEKRLQRGNA